jgi:diguanylate cyclase (GGDEF)-like protein
MPYRRALLVTGLVGYAVIFAVFRLFEIPGLGIGHFYYLAVALVALVTGPAWGIAAGMLADAMYALGIYLNPTIPSTQIYTTSTTIRFFTFTAMGALIGWFARDNRRLVEHLRTIADRDFLTELLNTRAFDEALVTRLGEGRAFALLLGDIDRLKEINDAEGHAGGNDVLRRAADVLRGMLRGDDAVARVGGDEFAILTSLGDTDSARTLCGRLTAALAGAGIGMSFGWAVHPRDGSDPLTLFRAADERLNAQKLIRSRLTGGQLVELPTELGGYSLSSVPR